MSLWFTIAFTYVALLLLAAIVFWVVAPYMEPKLRTKQYLQGAALSFIPMVVIMINDMWTM